MKDLWEDIVDRISETAETVGKEQEKLWKHRRLKEKSAI